ncbi:Zinc finger, FYVE-related [Phytophthora cactorum]|nr:Zinc finger, FYVE-related [Phytophthora cactorum]
MAEASPPRKPAALLEPERALSSHAPSIRETKYEQQTPRERVHVGVAAELNTMCKIRKLHKRQEQEQVRTARQRFVPDSEDEETSAASSSLKFVTLPPKLVTSKSEGRANALPSRRRQLQQQQILHPSRPVAQTTERTTSTREKLVRKYVGASPEHNRSFRSLSSESSHAPSEAAAAVALEQGLMSSQTFSTSAILSDEALVTVARRAKKQLEVVSKRQEMAGRWKRMARSKPDCQVFESLSKAKDQFSVVVKMNLPCSLREIMSVFSTDNETEFHRSMEAVFGDQYVYGVNVRSVDCASYSGGVNALRSRGHLATRRASEPPVRRVSSARIPPLRSAKLKLNAVSLMQKHRLVWKQRNMTFLDYLAEKIETKSVTRVMQTMDMQDEELEFSSVTTSSPTAASSKLKGILAGYVIQEDSEDKCTRLFFYATHHHRPTGQYTQTRMPRSAVQLLRAMVNKVCLLESVVLRRRLGYYPLSRLPTSHDEATMASYCATCYTPFSMLRKKYFCRLCGHYTCRKCSDLQDVEKTVGLVEKHRVCVSCVRRVSYCVFNMCAFPPNISSNVSGNSWTSARSQRLTEIEVEDDFDPPIMDDLASEDIEDVEVVHTAQPGALAGFVSDLLHGKDKKQELKKQELAAQRKQRLQLTIDDLGSWTPGPIPDSQSTPKESISLLDSFCTSHSSASSRSRDLPSWLSPTPMGG